MKAFLTPLQGLAEFEQIKEKSKTNKGILQVSGCMESQKSHLMYGLSGIAPYRLILAEDERRAREIYEDYRFYDRKVYSYPAKDLLFFQADIHGNLLIRQRMKVIKALLEEKELTVVTSIDGCMDFLESLEKIKEQLIHYESDSTVDTEQLKNQLVALGYERVGQVEMPGQFSVRGGIVDIYCLTEENPWRIELWGDEIDSIRSFDPESQRSLENLEELTIYPAVEHIGDKDMVSFLDYFPEERTIIFLDEPNRLTEKGGAVEEEYRQSRMHREEKGSRNLPENWLCSFEQLQKELNKRNCISVCALEPKQAGWKVRVMNILCASDRVIIPVEASPWGMFGLANMFEFLNEVKQITPELEVAGIAVTKVDTRKSYYKQTMETLHELEDIHVFEQIIRVDSSVEWSQDNSIPVVEYKKSSRSAREYTRLAEEVMELCQ